jgi:hypothetical protein
VVEAYTAVVVTTVVTGAVMNVFVVVPLSVSPMYELQKTDASPVIGCGFRPPSIALALRQPFCGQKRGLGGIRSLTRSSASPLWIRSGNGVRPGNCY